MNTQSGPQRGHARFLAALPAILRYAGDDLPCEAFNLSRSGVLLVGDLPQPEEPELELCIAAPAGDLELRAVARLVHVQRDDAQGVTRLGLQFIDLDAAHHETVDLLVARVVEGVAPAALEGLPDGASVAEIREALGKISTGHRVALAQRGQARERGILRHDPDPHVLEALARNPGISLPEIIGLARMPQLLPSTVEIMAGDPRWSGSDELKILLVTHPRATFSTADGIVSRMSDLLVQRVLRRPGLHPAVREKVMVRLARKHRG